MPKDKRRSEQQRPKPSKIPADPYHPHQGRPDEVYRDKAGEGSDRYVYDDKNRTEPPDIPLDS